MIENKRGDGGREEEGGRGRRGERRRGGRERKRTECTFRQRRGKMGEGRKGREWDQGILLASIPGWGKPSPRSWQI